MEKANKENKYYAMTTSIAAKLARGNQVHPQQPMIPPPPPPTTTTPECNNNIKFIGPRPISPSTKRRQHQQHDNEEGQNGVNPPQNSSGKFPTITATTNNNTAAPAATPGVGPPPPPPAAAGSTAVSPPMLISPSSTQPLIGSPSFLQPLSVARVRSTLRGTATNLRAIATGCIEPSSSFYHHWSFVIYLGVLYNAFACVIGVFDDTSERWAFFAGWMGLNACFDVVYALDVVVNSKLTHMESGMEVRSWRRLAKRYFRSTSFLLDLIALLPSDLALLHFGGRYSLVRVNRLLKAYRLWDFVERSSMRTNYPNALRIFHIVIICIVVFHWNAALYFKISLMHGINSTDLTAWEFNYVKNSDPLFAICPAEPIINEFCSFNESAKDPDERERYVNELMGHWSLGERYMRLQFSDFAKQYSLSIYWSSLTLTTSGQQPYPTEAMHNFLEIFDTIVGVLVFAVIVGSVGNAVTAMNRANTEVQQLMDGLKFYMNYRNVSTEIQKRVMDCVGYIQQYSMLQSEADVMECLPPRLQSELAVDLHLGALSRVELFGECEPSLLNELTSHLSMEIYSPNDYLCRADELAKEMFVVKKGSLEVLSAAGDRLVAVLGAGQSFGELSMLKVTLPNGDPEVADGSGETDANTTATTTTRRHESLRSIGYSEVYVLRQESVLAVLSDYPEERRRLVQKAGHLLRLEEARLKGLLEGKRLDAGGADDPSCSGDIDVAPPLVVVDPLDQLADAHDMNEVLQIFQEAIQTMSADVDALYEAFRVSSSSMKKQVSQLEELYYHQRETRHMRRARGGLRY